MRASTIKLDEKLLKAIGSVKPPSKSLSAFVREVLEQDVRRRKLREAGQAYVKFLTSHSKEEDWLDDWESADLSQAPKPKGKK